MGKLLTKMSDLVDQWYRHTPAAKAAAADLARAYEHGFSEGYQRGFNDGVDDAESIFQANRYPEKIADLEARLSEVVRRGKAQEDHYERTINRLLND